MKYAQQKRNCYIDVPELALVAMKRGRGIQCERSKMLIVLIVSPEGLNRGFGSQLVCMCSGQNTSIINCQSTF